MTSGNAKTHRPRSKPRTHPSLDVMVARGTGRVRTFRISPRILLMGLIFFILYIPISVLIINDYLSVRQEQEMQRDQVSRLQAELDDARKMIFRYQQRVAILREHVQTDKAEPPVTSIKEIARTREPIAAAPQEPAENPFPSEMAGKTILDGLADIKDLAIYREGGNLKVTFKIVNLRETGTLEGYAFIVALDPGKEDPGAWSYPQAALQAGMPVDHRSGFHFAIRNFKAITMTHGLGPQGDWPPILRILIYDRSGNLLRKEDMEVKAEG
jgi:hypothetical protein